MVDDPRRAFPSVSALLEQPALQALLPRFSQPVVVEQSRAELDAQRRSLSPDSTVPAVDDLANRVVSRLEALDRDRLRGVVNGTGILLHTGLGRAVLPPESARALAHMDRCCNLQIDLSTGKRGKRNHTTEALLCRLTGAEAAMVVNNNAAATLLVLAALCRGREVIVSRGQLIEIGGSFRLPDCIEQSGATMVEVGTTNKTHLRDYRAALSERTAAVLRVNPSNYRIVGFNKSVSTSELVTLKEEPSLLVIDDLGCGALVDLQRFGLPYEPTVPESMAAGADLALFSGDKLIGGPQAGIIVGRADLISAIKKHPLTRMLRVGKLTDAALEQALRLHLDPETLAEHHPTLRMLTEPPQGVKRRAMRMRRQLASRAPHLKVEVVATESAMGGGSLPGVPIPSWALAIQAEGISPDRLCAALRLGNPPVITRVHEGAVRVDLRTVLEGEGALVIDALAAIVPRPDSPQG